MANKHSLKVLRRSIKNYRKYAFSNVKKRVAQINFVGKNWPKCHFGTTRTENKRNLSLERVEGVNNLKSHISETIWSTKVIFCLVL